MAVLPKIDLAVRNNVDGVWARDVSAILAADPEAATASWRMQVRSVADDHGVVLDIPATHGSIDLVAGVLIHRVPLSVMRTLEAGTYVWDGLYVTVSGRTVPWAAGAFVVEQGVTR